MFEPSDDARAGRSAVVPASHHHRMVLMLVSFSCLSLGVAIGALVRGIAGAESDENRLIINHGYASADALSAAFIRVAQQVEPSVVNISVREGEERSSFTREGTGSGVIVTPNGHIITNDHVIKRATRIKVRLATNKEYEARVLGQDPETDLAVIKIEAPESLPAAHMGDSDRLNVGDWVLAIGSPFGLEQTVTAGIISAKDRVTDANESVFQQFLQTDAAINPGNSGGPLVNLGGEVVGINTQIATQTGAYNGIGFALPSSTAVAIYNDLVAHGRIRRGFLGIRPVDLSSQMARQYEIKDEEGVLVGALTGDDSPAARAGLDVGDVIIAINGEKIKDVRQLIRWIASLPVGSTASVVYVRDGKQRTALVKLEERPREEEGRVLRLPGDPGQIPESRPKRLGLTVQTLTPEAAKRKGIEGAQGAVVTMVEPGSVAREQQVRLDDIIVDINRKAVTSEEDFRRIIGELKPGDEVVIKLLRREGLGAKRLRPIIVTFLMP